MKTSKLMFPYDNSYEEKRVKKFPYLHCLWGYSQAICSIKRNTRISKRVKTIFPDLIFASWEILFNIWQGSPQVNSSVLIGSSLLFWHTDDGNGPKPFFFRSRKPKNSKQTNWFKRRETNYLLISLAWAVLGNIGTQCRTCLGPIFPSAALPLRA